VVALAVFSSDAISSTAYGTEQIMWTLVVGSALLIDYVLTVAVSVSSGVAALTTAPPPLQRVVLQLSLSAIGLIMWANLRRVRKSGRIFAIPTSAHPAGP
jgi:K+ transporter